VTAREEQVRSQGRYVTGFARAFYARFLKGRVAESSLALITNMAGSAPYEELRLKAK